MRSIRRKGTEFPEKTMNSMQDPCIYTSCPISFLYKDRNWQLGIWELVSSVERSMVEYWVIRKKMILGNKWVSKLPRSLYHQKKKHVKYKKMVQDGMIGDEKIQRIDLSKEAEEDWSERKLEVGEGKENNWKPNAMTWGF